MLITPAYAQAATGAGGGDFLVSLLPFLLIFVIMYFLIIRPQQKRMKSHQEMLKNLRRGDSVVTAGGIIGKIVRIVDDNEVVLEIADNVRVKVARAMISDIKAKGEPVSEEAA